MITLEVILAVIWLPYILPSAGDCVLERVSPSRSNVCAFHEMHNSYGGCVRKGTQVPAAS